MANFSNNHELRIPGIILPALNRYEQDIGVNLEDILSIVGSDFDFSDLENQHIDCQQFKAILNTFIDSSEDEAVGLLFGDSFSFDFMYEFEMFLQTSNNLNEIFPVLIKLANALMPLFLFYYVHDEKAGIIYANERVEGLLSENERMLLIDATFSMLNVIFSRMNDPAFNFESVSFNHKIALPNIQKYTNTFKCPVYPGSLVNAFRFQFAEKDTLSSETSGINSQVYDLVLHKINSLQGFNNWTMEVMSRLESSTSPLKFSLPKLAADLGVSTRTLQRKLSEEGSSHRALVDLILFNRAKLLLQDMTLCLEKVASLLGYTSRRGLNRLIYRCTGTSPSGYRKMLCKGDGSDSE